MKLKKMALRGLILLAVAVALCMFFARTVQTITTAKIKLTTAGTGRFEDRMTFKASVHFPETEEITIAAAAQNPVTVEKVLVKPGAWVNAGDTVFTCKVTGLEDALKKLRDDYAAKQVELLDLDTENRSRSRDSKANQCYQAMLDASKELLDAVLDAQVLASGEGVRLSGPSAGWSKLLALLETPPSQALNEAIDKVNAIQSRYEEAFAEYQAVMEDKKQKVSSETFEYIKKRNALLESMDQISSELVRQTMACAGLDTITAPHSGYVTAVAVNAGDSYDGKKAAYTLSAEGVMPVLRAPLKGVERTIADGTRGEIANGDKTEKVTVDRTAVESDGEKYLYITLPESMAKEGSKALRLAMLADGVEVNITYRASKASTLLSPSVVRADGDNNFVYLVEKTAGSLLSSAGMKVVRLDVTVLERSDKVVSVAEDLSYQQLADREDRTLSNGQAVMEYVN